MAATLRRDDHVGRKSQRQQNMGLCCEKQWPMSATGSVHGEWKIILNEQVHVREASNAKLKDWVLFSESISRRGHFG
jgi:hypothetical protein